MDHPPPRGDVFAERPQDGTALCSGWISGFGGVAGGAGGGRRNPRAATRGKASRESTALPSGPKPSPVNSAGPLTDTVSRWGKRTPLTGSDTREEIAKFQTPWARTALHRL